MTGLGVLLVLLAAVVWPARPARAAASIAARPAVGGADDESVATGPAGGPRRAGWRGRRSEVEQTAALADVAESVAMALRAGTTPDRAVRVAGHEVGQPWRDVLADVGAALAQGRDAGGVWRRAAGEHPEAAFLAGAWTLSERLGTPLAPTTSVAAEVLRARLAVRRRLDAASAGPRATMVMLTALPAVGPLAGLAFGLAPWQVVTHSAVTLASVGVGALLTVAGWLLCRVVLRRALREQVHR